MKKNIKLSIIITIYNLEKYLSKCLDSILNQKVDFSFVEILLIDDGSTDNSNRICEKYSKKYSFIKYIYQSNKGVSAARNNGLSKACGEYVYMIDGDDVLLPDSLNKVVSLLSCGYDIIQSDFIKFYDEDKINNNYLRNQNVINVINNSSYPLNIHYLFSYNYFNLSLAVNIIKKSIIKNEKINENLKYTEDMDFMLTALFKSKSLFCMSTSIYGYRQCRYGSATSKVSIKRIEDVLFFIDKWEKYILTSKSDFKEYLMSFLAYQLLIIMGLSYQIKDKNILEKINKKTYILKYKSNKKVKLAASVYKIFGFKTTVFLMHLYLKSKKK